MQEGADKGIMSGMAPALFKQDISARRQLILGGSPFRVLLLLSAPTLLMAFVQSLIPLLDGFFLNNDAGYIAAGAVGYSQSIVNMLNALSQGIAVAAMAIIGQLNGRGDMTAVRHASLQTLVFSCLLGVGVAPLSVAAAAILSGLMTDTGLASGVFLYLSSYAVVIPFLFLAAVFNAIKNATGQPEATFYRMLLLLIAKILFNYLFLRQLRLGIVGASLASLTAYLAIGSWMYYDLFRKPGEMCLSLRGYRFDRAFIARLVRLGVPAMLNSIMMNLGFFLINTEVIRYGATVLNAQTIAGNVSSMAFTLPSSVGTTVTTITSINIAAGQERRARRSFWAGVLICLILSAVMIAIFVPAAPPLVGLFLSDPQMSEQVRAEITAIAVAALNIYMYSVIGFSVYMVAQGAFIGLGKTRPPLIGSILRIWLLRYLFILIFQSSMGYWSVFWGNLFSNTLSAVIFLVYLIRSDWNRNLIGQPER